MKWVKWILEIVIGVGLLVWAVRLVIHTEPTRAGSAKGERPPPTVYVEKVGAVEMDDTLDRIGTAQARESVVVTAQVAEKITKIHFEDGQAVKRGDVLVELDGAREAVAMLAAELAIAEHARERERLARLVQGNAVPQKDLDDRETRLELARAEKLRVETEQAYRVVKAPFAGVLGLRLVSLGDLVSPGTPIATLIDIDTVYVDFSAPEKYAAKLSAGQAFTAVNEAYPGVTFEGVIKMVEPQVNALTRSVQVRGVVDNAGHRIKPGMLLNVSLSTGVAEVTVVPEAALVSLGEKQFLFTVPEGSDKVARAEVKLGRRVGRWAEVTEGVARGVRIVTEGISVVSDGQRVVVGERLPAQEGKAE
ncbi:MAG: efflux RND transporter periplasmic adaptor subunit [Kiritimatiellaeota bacterium]|nr:efflux RND transporter periplasmic adaptor subunit [Kiritimatiellota bacterium]